MAERIGKVFPKNDSEIRQKSVDNSNRYLGLANDLVDIFGLGSNASIRRAFFCRLEEEAVKRGEIFYFALWRIAKLALTKQSPERYFCSAARNLIEGFEMQDRRNSTP